MALKPQEQLFATEYIANKGNAYQAAIKAGYSERTAKHAYQWLLEPQLNPTITRKLPFKAELAAAIKAEMERLHTEKTADAQEVIEYLTSVMRGEHTEQTLRLIGEGVQTIDDIEVGEKERLKAAEILAKIWGIVNNNVNVTVPDPVVITGGDKLED